MTDPPRDRPAVSRRSVLRGVGAVGLAGSTLSGCTIADWSDGNAPPTRTGTNQTATGGAHESATETPAAEVDFETARDSYPIMEGTVYETTVHVLTSAADGPTALLLGGVHGNETGGIEAARIATDYDVGRGKIVVIPAANKPAVEDGVREGPNGDLNRQFPVGKEPTTAVARGIWDVLTEHEPDYVIDMHTSKAVYQVHDVGVGQVVFPHGGEGAIGDAYAATRLVNEQYLAPLLGDELPAGYAFQPVYGDYDLPHMDKSEEDLLLVPKAAHDLDVEGWVTEVTYRGFDLQEVTFLHDRVTSALLETNGVPVRSRLDDADNPLLD